MNYLRSNFLFYDLLGVAGIIGAAVVLYLSISLPAAFPAADALNSVTGTVSWVTEEEYSLKFGLLGDNRTFSYARKGGEVDRVLSALRSESSQPLTVLVAPHSSRSASTGPFYRVYGMSSQNEQLRTFSQVRDAWNANYKLGFLVALMAFAAGSVLLYLPRRCAT